tara:strand:+ start:472 stop:978 length:507 start_codon:yes stop_codon:yes gene_type:complete
MAEFRHSSGTIKTESEIRADNAHTSFPRGPLSTDILTSLGYEGVLPTAKPTASSVTKMITRDGVEQNSNKQWVEKWKEVDRHSDYTDDDGKTVTKSTQDTAYQTSLDNNQKETLRNTRKPLLEEADWQIHKLEDASGDASAWKTYRQALRDITKASDIYNVTWPTKPS